MIFLQNLSAQDEGNVIEISEIIGLELDKKENNRYKIFKKIPGFRSATFYQKADSSYWVHIKYYHMGIKETLIRKFNKQDLNTIIEKIKSGPAKRETNLILKIKSTSGFTYEGILTKVSPGVLTLALDDHRKYQDPDLHTIETSIQLNKIAEICINKKTPIGYELGYGTLVPFIIGSLSGYLIGDGSENSAMFLGSLSASIGFVIGSSVGTLRSIDIDIPWQDKSFEEKQKIISDLYSDTYKPPFVAKLTPYIGRISPDKGPALQNYGIRLRTYFTLRSGLEIEYFQLEDVTGHNSYTKWIRNYEYYYSGFFLSLTKKHRANPFVAWGWGFRKQYSNEEYLSTNRRYNYQNKDLFLSAHFGIDVKIWNWVNSEIRLRYVWDGTPEKHFGLLIGLSFGPNYL